MSRSKRALSGYLAGLESLWKDHVEDGGLDEFGEELLLGLGYALVNNRSNQLRPYAILHSVFVWFYNQGFQCDSVPLAASENDVFDNLGTINRRFFESMLETKNWRLYLDLMYPICRRSSELSPRTFDEFLEIDSFAKEIRSQKVEGRHSLPLSQVPQKRPYDNNLDENEDGTNSTKKPAVTSIDSLQKQLREARVRESHLVGLTSSWASENSAVKEENAALNAENVSLKQKLQALEEANTAHQKNICDLEKQTSMISMMKDHEKRIRETVCENELRFREVFTSYDQDMRNLNPSEVPQTSSDPHPPSEPSTDSNTQSDDVTTTSKN